MVLDWRLTLEFEAVLYPLGGHQRLACRMRKETEENEEHCIKYSTMRWREEKKR